MLAAACTAKQNYCLKPKLLSKPDLDYPRATFCEPESPAGGERRRADLWEALLAGRAFRPNCESLRSLARVEHSSHPWRNPATGTNRSMHPLSAIFLCGGPDRIPVQPFCGPRPWLFARR